MYEPVFRSEYLTASRDYRDEACLYFSGHWLILDLAFISESAVAIGCSHFFFSL